METKVIIREAIVGKHVEFNSREEVKITSIEQKMVMLLWCAKQWESDAGLYSATLPLFY